MNTSNPYTLSIIIINLNSDDGLLITLSSLLNCKCEFSDFQLVVIDGKSSDLSLVKAAPYLEMCNFFISEKDSGIYDAMNKGLKIATGAWIWFLNSGDSAENFPRLLTEIRKVKDYNFIYGKLLTYNGLLVDQNFGILTLYYGMINHQSIFYRRDIINSYDLKYWLASDFYHLLNSYKIIVPYKFNFPIVKYDLNGQSSNFSRIVRCKIWFYKYKAFKNANIPILVKLGGMFFCICILCFKFFFPKACSKTLKIKSM